MLYLEFYSKSLPMLNLTDDNLNIFIEKLPIAIACLDENRRYFALNAACAEINGVSREDTLHKTIDEVVPDLKEVLTPIFDEIYNTDIPYINKLVEGKTPASDKVRYWQATYQPFLLSSGKKGLLVTAEEITQQVFATKSAETNRKLLTDVLNSLFTFVGLLDENGILLDANKAPLKAAGINIDQVQGKYFWDCFWWTYSDIASNQIKKAVEDVQNGKSVRFDINVRVAAGFITVDFMMGGVYDTQGSLTNIIPSAIDISERKHAEEKLFWSQARFETVINRTVDGLVACNESGLIYLVNNTFEGLVGKKVKVLHANLFDFIDAPSVKKHLSDLAAQVAHEGINKSIASVNKQVVYDLCVLKPTLNIAEIAFTPFLDGSKILYLATISDVSALYQANQALEKSLQEKTILLNEVHHRVKNNLQVMSSLLSLQANSDSTNTETRNALLDSQRRLESMALIHQLLYERDDFTSANLQEFTKKLLILLQDSMVNGNSVKLIQNFSVEPIALKLNQIVPYGFLVTELLTNAYKHAFTDLANQSAPPTITVTLSALEDNIKLILEDNGCGYRTKKSDRPHSLGGELVTIFTRQLRAEICTSVCNGVKHVITFKKI